jgi:hypothetical protein
MIPESTLYSNIVGLPSDTVTADSRMRKPTNDLNIDQHSRKDQREDAHIDPVHFLQSVQSNLLA